MDEEISKKQLEYEQAKAKYLQARDYMISMLVNHEIGRAIEKKEYLIDGGIPAMVKRAREKYKDYPNELKNH